MQRRYSMGDGENNGSLLAVVIDAHPGQALFRGDTGTLSRTLESLMVFCNSHLMLDPRNKLAVIASYFNTSKFLYPSLSGNSTDTRSHDGKYELFTKINNSIEKEIKDIIMNASTDDFHVESLLAGGLAMALCYINRIEKEEDGKISSRILVIAASLEGASQYMNFMNVFFAAQKQNVTIDVCILDKDSGLLQQGCDLTGGIYLKIPQISALLQFLLVVFLPQTKLRNILAVPPLVSVDYRAACFCHRNLIEIGYVCSVCLSIFCSFSPICSTCESTFKLPDSMAILAKMKKRTRNS